MSYFISQESFTMQGFSVGGVSICVRAYFWDDEIKEIWVRGKLLGTPF